MNILTFSKSAWDNSNSTGNTFSNFFDGYENDKIAHFYLRQTMPNNNVCKKYFSINEKMLLKSLIQIKYIPGSFFTLDSTKAQKSNDSDEHIYSFFREKKTIVPHILQNLFWMINQRWKNKNVTSFLKEFQPDIIFVENLESPYLNKILWYLQKKSQAKVVIFHTDDYLTVNSKTSLLEKKFMEYRAKLEKRSSLNADLNYGISSQLSELYLNETGKVLKTLYKGAEFKNKTKYILPRKNQVIKITYIGSILYGRWKTLALLAEKIKAVNETGQKYILNIYSQFELTEKMRRNMIIEDASIFLGKVSPENIKKVYQESDIVLHVESFDNPEKHSTKMSFSTKIVDLLNSGKPIMAIGWEEAASIDYLMENNAALVANNDKEILNILNEINNNRNILAEFSENAWECGVKNHQLKDIQNNLYQDLKLLTKEN